MTASSARWACGVALYWVVCVQHASEVVVNSGTTGGLVVSASSRVSRSKERSLRQCDGPQRFMLRVPDVVVSEDAPDRFAWTSVGRRDDPVPATKTLPEWYVRGCIAVVGGRRKFGGDVDPISPAGLGASILGGEHQLPFVTKAEPATKAVASSIFTRWLVPRDGAPDTSVEGRQERAAAEVLRTKEADADASRIPIDPDDVLPEATRERVFLEYQCVSAGCHYSPERHSFQLVCRRRRS